MNEESIFATALQKKTANERLSFLDEACAGNVGLRAAVEELLCATSDAGSFLEQPPLAMDATFVSEPSGRDTVSSGTWALRLPFLEPCDKPDRIGKLVSKVGEYEVIEVVGQGGMGAVLRAFDTKLSRVVAVKVMSPGLASNPTAVMRFLREATTAAAVHHDHVVTIHAVDDAHRPPYLVMEFVDGQTLQEKIDREGALELKQILRIGSQAAAGLEAAHKMGLIHRDVKPANILLENGVERVKISDFGLARAADDLQITQTGLIAGTPQYMSPEQAKGESIDARSDLFSLGSVLYTMCTGRPAFRADSTVAVLRRVCDAAPRPIHEWNAEIPSWLEAIVNKLLAKEPADRFQTAGEVAGLLGQHLAHVQNPTQVPAPAPIAELPLQVARGPGAMETSGKRAPLRSRLRPSAALAVATSAMLFVGLTFTEASGVTHLTATIVRIATGDGTLVIESSDPGIKVAIDGEEVAIHGAGVEEVRLRPGSYKVAATKDGKPAAVDQELVTITRGGQQVVRVAVDRSALRQAEAAKAAWQPPENPNPTRILEEAKRDTAFRRYETALAKHVWYHKNALQYDQALTAVRVSFALQAWQHLADWYPPALAKLKATRDEAASNIKQGRRVWESFFDLVAINQFLREEAMTKDLFVYLHTQSPNDARRVFEIAEPALIRNKEYKLCGDYLDPEKSLERMVSAFREKKRLVSEKQFGKEMQEYAETDFTNSAATLVALLVVNDRKPEAEKVAHDAKKEWDNAAFHAAIDKALQGHVPEPWPPS
jgi:serine/threonine protein kinase